jgi:hypothetical protein
LLIPVPAGGTRPSARLEDFACRNNSSESPEGLTAGPVLLILLLRRDRMTPARDCGRESLISFTAGVY